LKNRIYFFTGTGNSLKVAEDIAKVLPESEVVAIHKGMDTEIPCDLDRIGFVFPVYFWGLPSMVADFLRNAHFPEQGSSYYFAVATNFGIVGNAIRIASTLLHEKGIHLNYSAGIRMFGNSITHYNMSKRVDKITQRSGKKVLSIVNNIKNNKTKKVHSIIRSIYGSYLNYVGRVHTMDSEFNTNNNCISCGICRDVCPAKNITLEAGRPVFHHQCESCLACIQHCPKRALNYKDKTQNRRRYTHPQVGHKKIANYYK
jgi:ferredoxin